MSKAVKGVDLATEELRQKIANDILEAVKSGLPWCNAQMALNKVSSTVDIDAKNAIVLDQKLFEEAVKKEQAEAEKAEEKAGE